jgi:hypothetical protein
MPSSEWDRKHRPHPQAANAAMLRAAAQQARARGWATLGELFAAVAESTETTPNPGRWGIPADRVDRDTEEALRWSPVVAGVVHLARQLVAETKLADGTAAREWLEVGA